MCENSNENKPKDGFVPTLWQRVNGKQTNRKMFFERQSNSDRSRADSVDE
jgi:hypothetical protein